MGIIYLIRHGQASLGAADYDQLSELGALQARLLGERHAATRITPTRIFIGAMKRHRQSYDAWALGRGTDVEPSVLTNFDEFDHRGILARHAPGWETNHEVAARLAASSNPAETFKEAFRAATTRWMSGDHDADYTETWAHFRQRVLGGLRQVAELTGGRQTSFVFTSGGPISVLLSELLGLDEARSLGLQSRLVNAGYSKLLVRDGQPLLTSINEHAHLEGTHPDAAKLITYV